METVNSVAAAAAKAVWGEPQQQKQHGDEPVSGQTGNTAKGEPYDAGNLDEPSNKTNGFESGTKSTGGDTKDAEFSKKTGRAATAEDTPDNPSTNLKERDANTTKGQGDVRDPEDPLTNPKSAPTDVDDTGDGPNKAQSLEGPGPKPVDEIAREHGGDAGKTETKHTPGHDQKHSDAGEEDGPGAKSTSEGTGELYVKSSGLRADGGDFDATKPGAGREAERLLEEKGVHPNADTKQSSDSSSNPTSNPEKSPDSPKSDEKKGLGQKIKDKLHRHH